MEISCKANEVLELLSGKWKHIILYHIMEHGTLRFSELQRLIPGITKKMLTTHLREFEANQIIKRKVYPSVPPKVEYSLSEYGRELIPIMEKLDDWGRKHAGVQEENKKRNQAR
ncbi:winged helix-turn-helix transcriptional regulator [Halobacillus litoralis]|uniref:winged helix-turn-helix transcriptional regulator n=1 Tax=Halobacillus litoralis TaxID=45668 RepID=UPI001CD42E30|nr:helix-turn-helix domain-containing protein [Halobacillus litoralis]MCA1022023.1 helix-turn-helix transcriptional regulator [Halobacillus litoralis]